uniref:Uncharacterized protein n=1 Tax=Gopherus agassizii TaxID=38772 RepID=A0A452J1J8_9SAUR
DLIVGHGQIWATPCSPQEYSAALGRALLLSPHERRAEPDRRGWDQLLLPATLGSRVTLSVPAARPAGGIFLAPLPPIPENRASLRPGKRQQGSSSPAARGPRAGPWNVVYQRLQRAGRPACMALSGPVTTGPRDGTLGRSWGAGPLSLPVRGAEAAPQGPAMATLKLVVLGDSAVGKSSLLLRFTDDTFEPYLNPTIGVDFKVKKMLVDGNAVQLAIWRPVLKRGMEYNVPLRKWS